MKSFFKWLVIIILSVASVFVYRAYQDRNDGVLEDMQEQEQQIATTTEDTQTLEITESWVLPEGWVAYENDLYPFSLAHPADWEAQDMLKPSRDYVLHEVSIHETEYDVHRASFSVRIIDRGENQSVQEWWNALLAIEDAEKEVCVAEYGDSAPCLYLRDMVDAEEETELAGEPAYKTEQFQFDHQEECVYVAHEEYIYGLCYDGSNPNDPDFETNKDVYANMLQSFGFVEETVVGGTDATILGTWKSADDEKAITLFAAEDVYTNKYDGEIVGEGTWELLSDGSLETTIGEDVFSYTVLEITEGEMTLSFMPRGNTLEYIRVTEIE